ncbi:acetylcholine receptor subunit alpha-like isoform X1 [Vespula squamosa]|uniref:Acetylcholine receptor subunit alpha-like isoform X1 n=1 Tax=Vespula squamosa TaxID=30214 RepID=A0ABD2B893_VESSQ
MPPIIGETLRVWFLSALVVHGAVAGNPDAKRLYDDLLSNYNKLVRPVVNTSDVLRVCIKLKLSQLIDVSYYRVGDDSGGGSIGGGIEGGGGDGVGGFRDRHGIMIISIPAQR